MSKFLDTTAVFEGLPRDISFEAALAIKAARGDPSAHGWTKQSDGVYVDTTRCAVMPTTSR